MSSRRSVLALAGWLLLCLVLCLYPAGRPTGGGTGLLARVMQFGILGYLAGRWYWQRQGRQQWTFWLILASLLLLSLLLVALHFHRLGMALQAGHLLAAATGVLLFYGLAWFRADLHFR